MYGCGNWILMKAECQKADAFKLWFWRRLLRIPWTARSSNQSILKEISPEYSLEGLMLKVKLQYFGLLMHKTDSFGKDPDAEKGWRQEEKRLAENEIVGWHHWFEGHEFEQALGVGKAGNLVCCSPWGRKELHMTKWLNWTEHLSYSNYSRKLQRKESSQTHSTGPPSPWYQNQTNISHKKKTTGQ